jgi:energy-coupling factor transport system ATP-binding protein
MTVSVSGLTYHYDLGSPNAHRALDNICLDIPKGQSVGILGATGSGKSTLVQHLNGLLGVQEGKIKFDDLEINRGNTIPREIRQKVGLVFQFAEFGFFEETVFEEVAFSPKQWGWDDDRIRESVDDILAQIGFPFEIAHQRSPFHLSGGQQRMLALASVLVMHPEVLILDEPTVGLDVIARNRIYEIVKSMSQEDRTLIIISHDMDFVASLVERVVVLKKGQVIGDGKTADIFSDEDLLQDAGLELPAVFRFRERLQKLGIDISSDSLDLSKIKLQLREMS